jgi:lysophospholipase L1-like esterase
MAMDHDPETEGPDLNGLQDLVRALAGMLRQQAWILVLILGGIGALEIGLRVLRPDMAGLIYASDRTGGHPVVLSEKSFRVTEATEFQDSPVILALGDSTTFGTGVGAEETWPLQLGLRTGPAVPVANAGFPGGEPRLLIEGLRRVWAEPAAPKVVLLLVTGNMISFTEFRKETDTRDPLRRVATLQRRSAQPDGLKQHAVEAVQASALWKAVSISVESFKYAIGLLTHRTDPEAPLSPLLAYGWMQPDLSADLMPRMWNKFEGELALLQKEVETLKACLVIGFLPPRFMLSDRIGDNLKFVPKNRLRMDAGIRVGEIATDLGVPFVNTTEPLREAGARQGPLSPPLYIPGDYTHLSAEGHKVIADAFAEQLEVKADCGLASLRQFEKPSSKPNL